MTNYRSTCTILVVSIHSNSQDHGGMNTLLGLLEKPEGLMSKSRMGETVFHARTSLGVRELHHDPIEVLDGRVQCDVLVQPKGWGGDVSAFIPTSLCLASCQ